MHPYIIQLAKQHNEAIATTQSTSLAKLQAQPRSNVQLGLSRSYELLRRNMVQADTVELPGNIPQHKLGDKIDTNILKDLARQTVVVDESGNRRNLTEKEITNLIERAQHSDKNLTTIESGEALKEAADNFDKALRDYNSIQTQWKKVHTGIKQLENLYRHNNHDIVSTFKDFTIPYVRENIDGVPRKVIYLAKAIQAYKAFTSRENITPEPGLTFSEIDSAIKDVILGIAAWKTVARFFGVEINDVPGFIRFMNQVESKKDEAAAVLQAAKEFHDSNTADLHSESVTHKVSPTSLVQTHRGRIANIERSTQDAANQISNLNGRIQHIRSLKHNQAFYEKEANNIAQELEQAKGRIKFLQSDIAKYSGSLVKLAGKFSMTKQALVNKYEAERQSIVEQLGLKYENKPKKQATELAIWEKTAKRDLANKIEKLNESLQKSGSVPEGVNLDKFEADLALKKQELDTLSNNIETLKQNLMLAKEGAMLSPLERKAVVTELERKRLEQEAHLRNVKRNLDAQKKILESNLDEDFWRAQILDKFEEANVFRGVHTSTPVKFLHTTILNYGSTAYKELMRKARLFQRSNISKMRDFDPPKGLVMRANQTFYVSTKYKLFNDEFLTLLSEALLSVHRQLDKDALVDIYVAGTLYSLDGANPARLVTFKEEYKRIIKLADDYLETPKGLAFAEELVEIMNDEGKFPAKLNRTQISNIAREFCKIVRDSISIDRLANESFVSYQEYMQVWVGKHLRQSVEFQRPTGFQGNTNVVDETKIERIIRRGQQVVTVNDPTKIIDNTGRTIKTMKTKKTSVKTKKQDIVLKRKIADNVIKQNAPSNTTQPTKQTKVATKSIVKKTNNPSITKDVSIETTTKPTKSVKATKPKSSGKAPTKTIVVKKNKSK